MSEIPFVNRLGDALESAAAHAPRRARPRLRGRLGLYLAAGALVVAGTAAAAGLFSGEKAASTSIGCFSSAEMDGGAYVWAGDRTPVAVCAEVLGQPESALVACTQGAIVAVIPGGADACSGAGLGSLGSAYEPERRRVAALEHHVIALERRADCLGAEELARRVQGVLDEEGWTGWTARVRDGSGPCGAVSGLGGGGQRSLSGALDADHHELLVGSALAFSTMEALYAADGLAGPLMDESGTACFTRDELSSLAERRLRGAGVRLDATTSERIPDGVQLFGERGRRYEAGCAVITSLDPGGDAHSVTLVVSQR